jgi:hypothetical protein
MPGIGSSVMHKLSERDKARRTRAERGRRASAFWGVWRRVETWEHGNMGAAKGMACLLWMSS